MSKIDALDEKLIAFLACPACKSSLQEQNNSLRCSDPACNSEFPVINGVPVLINEKGSLFSIADFKAGCQTTLNVDKACYKKWLKSIIPGLGKNWMAEKNYGRLSHLLLRHTAKPLVLVIGGSIEGVGLNNISRSAPITLIETDVSFGPRTMIVCDGHDIPFKDASFDAVVMQAVLEHVVDPQRVVRETHRVLKDTGFVYAETPFMQPVHLPPYDFTRFTCLGHRRLFRSFEEIDAGAVSGPAMVLGVILQYFLLSFAKRKYARRIIRLCTSLCFFWLKYLDLFLLRTPRAVDVAAGYYFLGRKSNQILSDRKLIQQSKRTRTNAFRSNCTCNRRRWFHRRASC
ncbi:MAG: methyltransferase domain-containing protein [Phycisphaerae bacterium]|nr:methyltransferase domain-containing protein [Phycisphaerae bacterium]